MARNGDVPPEDLALFRASVGTVRPLTHEAAPIARRRPAPIPRETARAARTVLEDALVGDYDGADLETGEELVYLAPGLQQGLLRQLRRGRHAVQGELDLHGLIVPAARQAVSEFLHECRGRGLRCVRIVHGKGHGSHQRRPVLKAKLNHWLRQRDDVLAFCSARPVDGGTGAVYVLLRAPQRP